MVSEKTEDVVRRATQLYEEKLRDKFERTNINDFVAIEPDSGEYFFGKTLSAAIQASRNSHSRPFGICDACRSQCSGSNRSFEFVNGVVDEFGRAFLDLKIRSTGNENPVDITVWIDTAFNGELVVPRKLIEPLCLEQSAGIIARLADGNEVTLESYACILDWFGDQLAVEVIANNGSLLANASIQSRFAGVESRFGFQAKLSFDFQARCKFERSEVSRFGFGGGMRGSMGGSSGGMAGMGMSDDYGGYGGYSAPPAEGSSAELGGDSQDLASQLGMSFPVGDLSCGLSGQRVHIRVPDVTIRAGESESVSLPAIPGTIEDVCVYVKSISNKHPWSASKLRLSQDGL